MSVQPVLAELPAEYKLEQLAREAKELFNQKQYKQAQIVFEEIFDLGIKLPPTANYMYAESFYQNRQYFDARRLFEEYIAVSGTKGRFFKKSMQRISKISTLPWKQRYSISDSNITSEVDAAAFSGDIDRLMTLHKRQGGVIDNEHIIEILLSSKSSDGLLFLINEDPKFDLSTTRVRLLLEKKARAEDFNFLKTVLTKRPDVLKNIGWLTYFLFDHFNQIYPESSLTKRSRLLSEYRGFLNFLSENGANCGIEITKDVPSSLLLPAYAGCIHFDLNRYSGSLNHLIWPLIRNKKYVLSIKELIVTLDSVIKGEYNLYGRIKKTSMLRETYTPGIFHEFIEESYDGYKNTPQNNNNKVKTELKRAAAVIEHLCSFVPPPSKRTILQNKVTSNAACYHNGRGVNDKEIVTYLNYSVVESYMYACRPNLEKFNCSNLASTKLSFNETEHIPVLHSVQSAKIAKLLIGFGAVGEDKVNVSFYNGQKPIETKQSLNDNINEHNNISDVEKNKIKTYLKNASEVRKDIQKNLPL